MMTIASSERLTVNLLSEVAICMRAHQHEMVAKIKELATADGLSNIKSQNPTTTQIAPFEPEALKFGAREQSAILWPQHRR
jgi:hypothetical protein